MADDPQAQQVLAELRGGEASLHHLLLVHRSAPNRADPSARGALRVGLAMRFIDASVRAPLATSQVDGTLNPPAQVRQTGASRECVTLVSGAAQHDGFDLEPLLPPNPSPAERAAGLAAHADAMAREKENYFAGSEASGYDAKV